MSFILVSGFFLIIIDKYLYCYDKITCGNFIITSQQIKIVSEKPVVLPFMCLNVILSMIQK